ncbi:MAG: Gfo/Idh/MocA family protein [Kiritimatiellia bacterium]
MKMDWSRRGFIQAGSLTAAGIALPGCLSSPSGGSRIYEPAPVPVLRKASLRAAGSKIRMGFIGVGGRGAANLDAFCKLGEEIVALCDVDRNNLDSAAKKVAFWHPRVRCYRDWRDMLDKEPELDAVVVSTPDHMHAICAIAAMERGCHVYVEKPLVRTWWEAERFRDVAKACGVVTQMGNNGNGSDAQRRSIEILQSGVFGRIREIHVTTNRPIWPQGLNRPDGSDTVPDTLDWNLWLGIAPKRPFKKGVYHSFKWRGWFDFGTGAMGDIACHAMSFFWRGLDLRQALGVETIRSTEKFAETYPKATTVKLSVESGRQDSLIDVYWYDGDTCPPPDVCRRLTNGQLDKFGGTMIVGEKGVFWGGQVMMNGEGKFVRHQDHPATRDIPQSLPRVRGHHWEFAEAIRGGARPFSDCDHSVPLTEAVLLGCISQRVPGRLLWNSATGRFTNSEEANLLLKPSVRHGWTIG